jgi:hypothetical protein
MPSAMFGWVLVRTLYELARYDVVCATRGFAAVRERLASERVAGRTLDSDTVERVCSTVELACCLYWKRVLCLQRSFCLARLLRGYGADAHLVIGYRPRPFVSHAWVEVDGRIVNDSAAYRQLRVLDTV